jgi:hypothetical protein
MGSTKMCPATTQHHQTSWLGKWAVMVIYISITKCTSKFNAPPRTEHLELHVSNFRNLLKWKVNVFR